MVTIPIDKSILLKLHSQCTGKVKYGFGSKPSLTANPGKGFIYSDCSGYVRWLLYRASNQKIKILPGSWHQQEWCKQMKFKKTDYNLHARLTDNRLRISFINPKPGKAGHVWLTFNGVTLESYGGKGVGSRAWNTPVLFNNIDACYVLTNALG